MHLKDKIAIVVDVGRSPGEGMSKGRVTVVRFAQDGMRPRKGGHRPLPAPQSIR